MNNNSYKRPKKELVEQCRRVGDRLDRQLQQLPVSLGDHVDQKLVHELQIHQIELEMQNEELRIARNEIESSRDKYITLYDCAPVSYFTFDPAGLIIEANLPGALLLGVDRKTLINQSFSSFVADSDNRDIYLHHLQSVLNKMVMLQCEINLQRKDGTVIYVRLKSITVAKDGANLAIHTTITDVSVRKQLETLLQQSHANLETVVLERTAALLQTNLLLVQEIDVRKKAEISLKAAYMEIKLMKQRLQAENTYLQQEVAQSHNFGEIIGQGKAISCVFAQIEQVAHMQATVLLLGETGVGKGIVARAIHARSTRKDRPMITVNCTSLPANLIESELFGREKGAFTGAHTRQMGRFELADGGTIFLDEIGEMPLDLQCKLLRVIQDGEFERLGSPHTIKVNVRIIAASNRNLQEEIKNGRFREDLYYRLNVFPITIPPLRQRLEDIPLLITHFMTKFNKKMGKRVESVTKETVTMLQEYNWPGNVRELESVIERAVITSPRTTLQILDQFVPLPKIECEVSTNVTALAEMEHGHIIRVLQQTGWRIEGEKGAARLLDLNPSTLRARMRKFGIVRK